MLNTFQLKIGASGIDTVGDVRVPAACCGVLGFRSSHGAISLEGTIPVASSFDAVGELLREIFFTSKHLIVIELL